MPTPSTKILQKNTKYKTIHRSEPANRLNLMKYNRNVVCVSVSTQGDAIKHKMKTLDRHLVFFDVVLFHFWEVLIGFVLFSDDCVI